MKVINENSAGQVTISANGLDGSPINPPATFRIDDEATGNSIRAATALSFVNGQATIPIRPEDSGIIDNTNEFEIRVITVRLDQGGSEAFNEEIRYKVRNLDFVSGV